MGSLRADIVLMSISAVQGAVACHQDEEVAMAALDLASPAAAMVDGADLAIDGGYTIP